MPKDPNEYTRIQFVLSELEGPISARTAEGGSLSLTAKRDLERYYYLMQRMQPLLTEKERAFFRDMLRGVVLDVPDQARLLPLDIQETGDEVFGDHGLSPEHMHDLATKLTLAECVALYDDAERYWLTRGE